MAALIFPQPHQIEWLPERVTLAQADQVPCNIVLADDAAPLERTAAEQLADAIAGACAPRPAISPVPGKGVVVYVGRSAADLPGVAAALAHAPANPEAYVLLARGNSVALAGKGPAGAFYAAQTLKQMLCREGDRLLVDGACIVDWPDYRYRSLYMESKWGSDLMGLQDWQDLIDYLAGLKFNSLGIGVYACWCVQYDGRRTEFLMVPFPAHPELETPKTIRYYSARERTWKAITYRPPMFEEDFLGQVVAYARGRNITVRPQFNGPGHTTLVPHTHPEVSAEDEAGRPTGYGYCLSNPRTYELLFELWDSIIDRYLAPSGVDWFHMGLDEIYATRGTDEDDPERPVDPWCKCPACRQRTQNELLVDYVVKATQHLAAKGMNNITIWNDHLTHSGILTPEFVRRLEEAGVKDKVALQWWRYDEPVLEIPRDLGLRAWTTPMPGYWFWLFTQSLTSNIYPHLHLAYRAGAEGSDAYASFDPAFDRNYHCLAEYAWNQTTAGDLYQFKSRYAQKVMGTTGFDAVEAFEKWDQVYDSMPLVLNTLDILLYYWHTYSSAREEYPRNVIRALLKDPLRTLGTYTGARTHLRRAHAFFAARRDQAPNPALIDVYLFECRRLIAVVDAFEAILGAIRQAQGALAGAGPGERAGLELAAGSLRRALDGLDVMMAFGEEVKKPYLLPQLLRDLSRLRGYLADLGAAIEAAVTDDDARPRLVRMLAELD